MKRSLPSCRILSLLALLSLFTNPAFAQQSSSSAQQPQSEFTLKRQVNRVLLDVVVTDSQHRPIRGLTTADFKVYEDRQPQKILSFDLHNLDSPPGYFRRLPALPPNTFVNIATEPEKGPLYVLLLDLLHTAWDDQPYARRQLLKFVDSKPEGTRFAVFVLSDTLHLVQGFTADRARLRAVLDPSHPVPHVPRIFLFGANYPAGMVSVFRDIAIFLDGLPGRKNIIWYSEGFPLQLFPGRDDLRVQREDVTEMLDALTRSECAIYPVDVSGVLVNPPGRLTGATTSAAPIETGPGALGATNAVPGANQAILNPPGHWATGTSRSGSGGGPVISEMATVGTGASSPWETEFVEDEIADFTGGRAFYSRNDLEKMLEEATEEGGNYYTLTYAPSNQMYDGGMRNISVRLAIPGKGFNLQYRRGYLATAPESPFMPTYPRGSKEKELNQGLKLRPLGDSLAAYMQHGAPIAREVYFQAHVEVVSPVQLATPDQMANLVDQSTYFRIRQNKHPKKALPQIKLQTYLIEYQIIGRHADFEVAAGVYDQDSRLLNGDVEEATSTNPNTPDPETKFKYFRVQQKIDVPAGAAWIRLGVRDKPADQMGTIEISLPLAPEPKPEAEVLK